MSSPSVAKVFVRQYNYTFQPIGCDRQTDRPVGSVWSCLISFALGGWTVMTSCMVEPTNIILEPAVTFVSLRVLSSFINPMKLHNIQSYEIIFRQYSAHVYYCM